MVGLVTVPSTRTSHPGGDDRLHDDLFCRRCPVPYERRSGSAPKARRPGLAVPFLIRADVSIRESRPLRRWPTLLPGNIQPVEVAHRGGSGRVDSPTLPPGDRQCVEHPVGWRLYPRRAVKIGISVALMPHPAGSVHGCSSRRSPRGNPRNRRVSVPASVSMETCSDMKRSPFRE